MTKREKENKIQRIFQRRQKVQAILYYGGKCECCGEKNIEFLTIDHTNGGGTRHRKEVGTQIANWIRRNGYPKGFRVLCYNCNMATGFFGECPHKTGTKIPANWTNTMRESIRRALKNKDWTEKSLN